MQYQREPTPLPPAQPEPRTPKLVPADGKTTARTLSANRWVKADGDQREPLVKKPKGARTEKKAGWVDLPAHAAGFERPGDIFADLVRSDYRRAATVGWSEGGAIQGSAVAGGKSGRTWVCDEPDRRPGCNPCYEAPAVAFRELLG